MVQLNKAGPLDYIRFVLSTLILLFSMVVTSYAIVETKTNFWHQVPGWAALLLFVFDLFILGIVEGLQIALVELKRQHPDSYKETHPLAYRLGQVASKGDNVERFLMGRQVFVVFLVFFAAKLTTIQLEDGEAFLFPVPWWVQSIFFESGILACIVVVIIAQLMPQIVAAKYPVHFLQFLIMRPAYYCCTFVEATGLTHATWLLSAFICRVCRMKDDKTTVNPNDIDPEVVLEDVEANMDSSKQSLTSTDISRVSSDASVTMKAPLSLDDLCVEMKPQQSHFTRLVAEVNKEIDPDTLRIVRHYLDTHPEKFQQFPSVVGNRMYPAPHAIAETIKDGGHEVPKFLTPITDPCHVPPHIVACELLTQNRQLQEELDLLKRKLGEM